MQGRRLVGVGLAAAAAVAALIVLSWGRGGGDGSVRGVGEAASGARAAHAHVGEGPSSRPSSAAEAGNPAGPALDRGAGGERAGPPPAGVPRARGDRTWADGHAGTEDARRGRLRHEIEDVVAARRSELAFCYDWEVQRDPALAGRVTLQLRIGVDGEVTEGGVIDDDLGNETVIRCFEGVLRRMHFAPSESGGEVLVHYPVVLTPDDREPDAGR